VDLLGALAEESRNEEPTRRAIAIRTAGGKAAAVLLAWLHPPQGQGTEPFGPLGAKQPQQSIGVSDASASRQIDDIVRRMAGWRGERLGQLRALIRSADPGVFEEVKWKKPSRPEGVPVWSHDGIVCIGEALKNAVRLTFPKGAQLKDPKGLFNTRLDSKTVRAIDFHEGDAINGRLRVENHGPGATPPAHRKPARGYHQTGLGRAAGAICTPPRRSRGPARGGDVD